MTSAHKQKWQFWIDRGGTFTDIVAKDPHGHLVTHKLLSDNPEQYPDAAVAGMRFLLGLKPDELISSDRVSSVKMGTTVATNALLERKGEPTVLVTTKGFRDALEIAYQNRPHLFDRHIQRPERLYQWVIEANERLSHDGDIVTKLDTQQLTRDLWQAFEQGYRAIAIVFMHGYRHHQHEQQAKHIAKQIGFEQISCSHQVSPMIKFVSRGDTTVVDAYLSPILRRYVNQICSQMPGIPLYFMQSSGGLTDAHQYQGKDAILSGPAGGIVGMARTAEIADFSKVIGFDMGGTSTDVSHFAGEFEREFDTQVAGVRLCAPMMRIHTVAAGGGSILRYDGARFRVGPDSAGANPGPACYRRGGPLTVTDANVLLGKIQPNYFPQLFGPAANQPIDKQVVVEKFAALATQTGLGKEAVAEGFIHIAVQQMANAIKKISIARGYDVTTYLMQCFGGAGAQHACLVADALGIKQILIHPFSGVLSAYGMGLADQSLIKQQSLDCPLQQENFVQIQRSLNVLSNEAASALNQQYVDAGELELKQRVHLRYQDSDTALIVPFADIATMAASFEQAYKQQFSFLMTDKAIVVEAVSAEAVLKTTAPQEQEQTAAPQQPLSAIETVDIYTAGQWQHAELIQRDSLHAGQSITGPAILIENNATTIIEPGWQAQVTSKQHLLLQKKSATTTLEKTSLKADPVTLEVFNNLFMNIAEQMGLQLQNTALSVNIKERLDFSCAVFDATGQLIANAPHVPVHLGSMGESIKSIIDANRGTIEAGDVFLLNDPYHGGTHLPDMTVITPVFLAADDEPVFYVGSRGHHADIGGKTPGSIPAFSTHIDEEGIRITNFKLVSKGTLQQQALTELLMAGPYPARNSHQNLADLRAQIAANEKGVQELNNMVEQYSLDVVQAYMQHVQDNAERAVREVIKRLNDGAFWVELDNGSEIKLAIKVDKTAQQATIDFSGTSKQQNTNFNAPKAVAIAAVLYVFRTLVDDDIPLNAGCLKPIELIIPEGSMLNPIYPAAVVAGNVETSTCITNALYGALGVMASAQPTMNNLTFGNQTYQYYETLAGGTGAGGIFDSEGKIVDGFAGTNVVQSLMTNSRLTDPEVLESRYPVRVCEHAIENGSGGTGRWQGGDGAKRRLLFLEPMTVSILSNGRVFPAFGLQGGKPGRAGENRVIRACDSVEMLAGCAEIALQAGDSIEIITPGGGGFGET